MLDQAELRQRMHALRSELAPALLLASRMVKDASASQRTRDDAEEIILAIRSHIELLDQLYRKLETPDLPGPA